MGLFGKLFNKNEESKPLSNIKSDNWNFYTYQYGDNDELTAMIDLDVEIAKTYQTLGYGNCRRLVVYINPQKCNPNGLPNLDEHKSLVELESDFIKALQNTDCKLVARMTYGMLRDFVFQVNDVAGFTTAINPWMSNPNKYNIELAESVGWDFYERKIKPSAEQWQQMTDRRIIGTLIQAGSDANKPHVLEHVVTGPMDGLQKLVDGLAGNGFTVAKLENGVLQLNYEMPLNAAKISEMTDSFVSYSATFGCRYDGWGAAVVN